MADKQRELFGVRGVSAERASRGARARDDAVRRADRNANPEFIELAYRAGCHLAKSGRIFTSADIRDLLERDKPEIKTHDDRALGPVMRRLRVDGVIEPTGDYSTQARKRNHCRPLREWRGKCTS
jgi:hypothetical protein